MDMKTSRIISTGIALAAVATIAVGAIAFAASVAPEPAEPTRVSLFEPATEPAPFVAPISEEDEQIAEAAREAARIEAERIAAEKAAAEAARIAAEKEAARLAAEEAARQSQSGSGQADSGAGEGDGGTSPAPAPAPAPPRSCAAGDAAMEYDGAGNAISCLPAGCLNGTVDSSRPECQTPYRP